MYMRRTLALIVVLCLAVQPGWAEEKKSWLGMAQELIARHPAWFAYDDISPQFVVFVPLDEGVKMSRVEGGPKRIGREPEIYLYGTSSNEMQTLQGELRVMKKDGKHDVLEAFKKLKVQEVGETEMSESILSGDQLEGRYILAYKTKDGSIVAEKIINIYDDFALSYRITTKVGTKEEKQAQSMVADYTILRACSKENAGDGQCVTKQERHDL